jgi:hypothetical protein
MALELSFSGLSVMLAIPVNRDFPWQTENSVVKTVCELKDRGVPFTHQLLTGGSIIQAVRSNLAHTFLKSDCNRIFWLDSDMEWEPDAFMRILALSSKMPVVGASYALKKEPHLEFALNMQGDVVEANEWGCIQVAGMGLGFTCVAREVIEQLAAKAPLIRNDQGEMVPMIFHCGVEGEKFVGEDMNFFKDCQRLGYDVNIDPYITLGHVGGKSYKGKLMEAMMPAQGAR